MKNRIRARFYQTEWQGTCLYLVTGICRGRKRDKWAQEHRGRVWHEKYSSVEKSVLWTLIRFHPLYLKKLRTHHACVEGWICKGA